MGQRLGRLPESREALQTEHRRVIHWSAEVLAWVDENVEGEDSFLVDYDNDAIETKVDTWLEEQRFRIEAACIQKPEYSTDLNKSFIEVSILHYKFGVVFYISFVFYNLRFSRSSVTT